MSDKSQDKSTERITLREFESKLPGKYLNPCELESRNSLKCLEKNNFDKKYCREYFEAYNECKKLWINERKKARFG
ncbi:Cytochrome c oxidase-assembly factor COX23, mitochondrial [Zancudomyces culisetae]|uniref:Cytochrome c oxidase-assembly factor COX23, mitochondrial n=1 Tax=Zancudomyces culisetae TaxID=1213189 RepID=A0A1R1PGG3_ZANCU|nr:Cytochrome c oxidase-assembly factor COX23, mitochondrial [Zancudomyces culisetae]|eukprot:OMH80070.1 Cytochrome c oxidase-assembly factor COX23, mitochondrial [Zancudomyces culisetae]